MPRLRHLPAPRALLLLAALPLAAAGAAPARAQDTVAVAAETRDGGRRSDAVLWAGAGALLAGSVLLDRTVHDAVGGGNGRLEPLADRLNPLGNPKYGIPLLAGGWAVGRLVDEPRLSQGSAHVLAGLLVAGVANGTLKYAVGRNRPSRTDDPFRFRPGSGDNQWQSFPSGHAVVAFSLAAGISEEAREPWVTAATYGTAALVAWSRVYEDKHWTSDVVAGALIGTVTSRATVRGLRRRAARREGGEGPRVAAGPVGFVVSIPTR